MGRNDVFDVNTKDKKSESCGHLSFCDDKLRSGKSDSGKMTVADLTSSTCCGAEADDRLGSRDLVKGRPTKKPDGKFGAWGPVFKDRENFSEMHWC